VVNGGGWVMLTLTRVGFNLFFFARFFFLFFQLQKNFNQVRVVNCLMLL
jgi:hypothetical protein